MFPRHGIIETINFAIGITLNAFLLYLIRRFSRKELGAYKHLLTIFAAHDILLSLVEALFCATAVRLGSIFSIVCLTFWESRHVACAYVTLYTLPFILTNVNFLYRYWAIKHPEKLVLYTRRKFQATIVSVTLSGCACWYTSLFLLSGGGVGEPATILLREYYNRKYNLTINDGWIVLDYWPDGIFASRPFVLFVIGNTMMLVPFISAALLSTMTFYHIHANRTLSESYRKFQRRVLIALCAQTIVPLLCVYVPYVSALNTPESTASLRRKSALPSFRPFPCGTQPSSFCLCEITELAR